MKFFPSSMKAAISIAAFSFVAPIPPSAASNIAGDGKIDSVTVYSNRAAVSRVVEVEFGPGGNVLTIEGIPATADDSSVRVTAKTSSTITIQGVDVSLKELSTQADPKVEALLKQIEDLRDKINLLEIKRKARQDQVEFIDTLARARAANAGDELVAKQPVAAFSVEDLEAIMNMAFEKKVAALEHMSDIAVEQRELRAEVNRLERELGQARGGGARTKTVAASFNAAKAGRGAFTIEYMVPGAWWRPEYVIRGGADNKSVEVSYNASITQRTGEDWNGVTIKLSTARPATGAKAPEVEPWYVGVREADSYSKPSRSLAMKKKLTKSAPMDAKAPMEMEEGMAADSDAMMASRQAVAQVEASGHVVNFEIPQRADVASGGDVKKVSVGQLSFEAKMSWVCSPAFSQNVFIRATAPNTSQLPMLPGPANVFQGDSFVGKSELETVAPGQKLKLDLGVDPSFKVKRKLVKREGGSEGIISSSNTASFVYEVELESFHKRRETVEVVDRIPQSQDERLTVQDVKLAPKPDKRDERSIITWNLDMRPKEKKTIRMEFTLAYPPGTPVYGF